MRYSLPVVIGGRAVIVQDAAAPISGNNFLIGTRSATDSWNANQQEFFGGKIDPGETIAQGILREAREEIGLDIAMLSPEQLPILVEDRLIKEGRYKGHLYLSFFCLAVLEPTPWFLPRLSPEHATWTWLPFDELVGHRRLTRTSRAIVEQLKKGN